MSSAQLDVGVLGGGLAGNLLVRQLLRTIPGLRVGLFEKSTEPSYKVGESTVEIASNYLIRRQGLSRYLYENHLPKNGLRYFFDDPSRSTELEEMSEIGTVNMPFHPAFQIERARMERDLLEMNRCAGARVETGVRIHSIELGADGAPHRFAATGPGGTERISCRWLVDAAGRNGLVTRSLDLRVPEPIHRIGAVWGRFEGVADLDDLGSTAFRDRVRQTSRGLSTVHFCYPGYWIWFIPLRGGLTSVGVVGVPAAEQRGLRSAEGLRRFLDEHRAARSLLANAKGVDVGSYARIAYGTRHFFHPDRWALVGEAANSADPLYSPGSDFIAIENDFLTDLVQRDANGEAAAAVAERCTLYDGFMNFRHEATMRLYRGLYGLLGSYELMRLKWDFDIGCYYNLWVSPYMLDQYLDPGFLRRQLRQQRFVLTALDGFAALFVRAEASLRERGLYYRANRGVFSRGLENIDFLEEIGLPRSRRQTFEQLTRTFNGVRHRALELIEAGCASGREDLPLTSFGLDRDLS